MFYLIGVAVALALQFDYCGGFEGFKGFVNKLALSLLSWVTVGVIVGFYINDSISNFFNNHK